MRAVFVMLFVSLAAPVGGQTELPDAPFRIVSVKGREVRVDVGARRARAKALDRATILTPAGAVPATLVRSERICDDLCPEIAEAACHYEAVLRTERPAAGALAAFAGRRNIGAVARVNPGPEQPITTASDWIEAEPVPWKGQTLRWSQFADGVVLHSVEYGRDFNSPALDLAACTTRTVTPLTWMVCPQVQLLYADKRAVAVSLSDYSDAALDPQLRIQIDGKDAFLIRLGLKAGVTIALVIHEAGRWRVRFREFDYPLIC